MVGLAETRAFFNSMLSASFYTIIKMKIQGAQGVSLTSVPARSCPPQLCIMDGVNHLVNNSLVIGPARVTGEQGKGGRRLRLATRARPPVLPGPGFCSGERAPECQARAPGGQPPREMRPWRGPRALHRPLSLLLLTPLCLLLVGASGE